MCQSILCFLLINYSVFFHVRKEGGQSVFWCGDCFLLQVKAAGRMDRAAESGET